MYGNSFNKIWLEEFYYEVIKMDIKDWFKDVINKGGVDKDGMYGKQCMDLWNDYAVRVLGLQNGKTGASNVKQLLKNNYVMSNLEKLRNTKSFVAQTGDIAISTKGENGHICIVTYNSTKDYFISLDQNYVPQKLTEEKHSYNDYMFFRFKKSNKYEKGRYEVTNCLNVRTGAGVNNRIKNFNEFTINAQTQITNLSGIHYNLFIPGVVCDILEVQNNWGRCKSGWICLDYCRRLN